MSEPLSPYQHLPELTPDEYEALKEDIREHGVLVPVEVDEQGNTLDGHHRRKICAELGITPPTVTRTGMTETEKHEHALKLNLQRRNLTTAQKRELITSELDRDPDRSDRAIARLLGVDHKTVGKARHRDEDGEIPQPPRLPDPGPEPEDEPEAVDPDLATKTLLLARKIVRTCDPHAFADALRSADAGWAAKLRDELGGSDE